MRLRYTEEARRDLREAYLWLAQENRAAANRTVGEIRQTIWRLASGELQIPRTQLRGGMLVQSWPVRPYRIYYRQTGGVIEIVRIYHQARRPIGE